MFKDFGNNLLNAISLYMKKSITLLSRAETTVSLQLLNGWEANGHEPFVTKIGKVVFLNVLIRKGIMTANTLLFVIPSGFKPKLSVVTHAITESGNAALVVYVNGEVRTANPIPNNGNVQINASWIIGS